jgi:hypothetical protein
MAKSLRAAAMFDDVPPKKTRRSETPQVITKHQMDPRTMTAEDWHGYATRPGRPLSAPPWRETGRETVTRVLGRDVNLPVEKKKSMRSRAISKR